MPEAYYGGRMELGYLQDNFKETKKPQGIKSEGPWEERRKDCRQLDGGSSGFSVNYKANAGIGHG
jgi:hypothetical protein